MQCVGSKWLCLTEKKSSRWEWVRLCSAGVCTVPWWCTMWLYCTVMQHMPGSHPCQAQETGSEVGQIQDKTASSQEKTQSWSSKSKASDFIRYSQVYKFCNILDSFKRFCELKCSTAFLSWDTWKFYSPNCNEYLYVYCMCILRSWLPPGNICICWIRGDWAGGLSIHD